MQINTKKLIPILIAVAAVFLVGGILIIALLTGQAASSFTKVLTVMIGILCILLSGVIAFIIYTSQDNDPNFFLYDSKLKRNIAVEELTFERVNSRMGYYMSLISSSQVQTWKKNILGKENDRFGANDVYKPLVAYKMLCDLCELDRPETWKLFNEAPPEVITGLIDALRLGGENEMCKTLRFFYEKTESNDDIEHIRDFVMGNAKYIRTRMMRYITKNIEWFY